MDGLKLSYWLNKFKQYFFTYSNGFYHLPYSNKSPKDLVDSFAKFPFVKHNKIKQSIYANTPFCEGGFNYQKLEDDCWIIYSKMRYKTNVAFDLIYDSPDEVSEKGGYYMLSLNYITDVVAVDKQICSKQVSLPKYSWTFFKPNERNCDLNFKDANSKYITLYFNDHWLQKNLVQNSLFKESGLDTFLKSEQAYIAWPLSGGDSALENFTLFDDLMISDSPEQNVDFLTLKFSTINLIFEFFRLCKEQQIVDQHVVIAYDHKFLINKVENYLSNHLFEKFPGIDYLAAQFKISESKLKSEFKQYFGKSIFQYFQEQQMNLAKELLNENQLLIKEISYKFGYENSSKFTAAFKKYHNILPSELQKQVTGL